MGTGDALWPAMIAVGSGVVLAVGGLVPWAAVQYRRRGELGFGPSLIAFGALVYALAIVSYTLLPLPSSPESLCRDGGAAPQLYPLAFVGDIAAHGGFRGSATGILHNPAFLQVVFNVLLFVPLGMLVRHLLPRRGIVTGVGLAAAAGLAVSLLVEVTQLTGVWQLYPCAYRLFDVDDLIANTAGAVVGGLLSPLLRPVSGRRRRGGANLPRPVGVGRRLIGMVCDVLAVTLGAVILGVAANATVVLAGGSVSADGARVAVFVLGFVPAFVQLVLVFATGRTLGEAVVRLRPEPRPRVLRAFLRWLVGIGGWSLLVQWGWGPTPFLASMLALVSVVMVFTTRGHRGLGLTVAGVRIVDERAVDGGLRDTLAR